MRLVYFPLTKINQVTFAVGRSLLDRATWYLNVGGGGNDFKFIVSLAIDTIMSTSVSRFLALAFYLRLWLGGVAWKFVGHAPQDIL